MEERQVRYEWKDIPADTPIRQGDLLAILNRKSHAVEKMLVVITADCDLAQDKYGSQVACLSMRFHEDYIQDTWSEAFLANTKLKAVKQARDKLRACVHAMSGTASDFSTEAAEDWMLREDWKKIAATLCVPEDGMKSFERSILPCQRALHALKKIGEKSAFDRLREFTASLNDTPLKDTTSTILKKAHEDKIPSDIFLLPGFPGHIDRPALVFLRSIVGVSPSLIATRPSAVASPNHFIRVGRLRSTFKYALSQAFGALYSKIGFPLAYEERRALNLKRTLSYA